MTAKQIRHTHDLLARSASRPVTIQVTDSNHQGWHGEDRDLGAEHSQILRNEGSAELITTNSSTARVSAARAGAWPDR